jgi:hypothetical protein
MGKTKKDSYDDPAISRNHNKAIKFRIRMAEEQEAKKELREQLELFDKEYDEDSTNVRRTD